MATSTRHMVGVALVRRRVEIFHGDMPAALSTNTSKSACVSAATARGDVLGQYRSPAGQAGIIGLPPRLPGVSYIGDNRSIPMPPTRPPPVIRGTPSQGVGIPGQAPPPPPIGGPQGGQMGGMPPPFPGTPQGPQNQIPPPVGGGQLGAPKQPTPEQIHNDDGSNLTATTSPNDEHPIMANAARCFWGRSDADLADDLYLCVRDAASRLQ
jgi:hypothetical protein